MKYILCLMFAVLSIVTGCAIVTIPLFPSEKGLQEQVVEGEGTAKILLVDISAVISEKEKSRGLGLVTEDSLVARIKEELQKAEKDEYVKGMVVKINSPGGTVTATDTIYHELMEFKRRTGTRIFACVTGLAVSGGYYVASAADEIIAHPTSVTGNIGVIALKFNVDQLLSKVGIQEETVKSADKKDIWSPFRPSTPEEKEIIQSVIDTFHDRFVGVVHAGRKALLSKEEVDKLADGRIFTAEQALAAKLIDKIGYLDDAVKAIEGSLNLTEAKVITYLRSGSYKGSIYSSIPQRSDTDINLIAVNGDFLSLIPEVQFMYLWRP
jgi:protease-4